MEGKYWSAPNFNKTVNQMTQDRASLRGLSKRLAGGKELNFADFKIKDFINVLASKEPIPGGGGVSALVGSLGVALGSMVGNLTLGKKKYEDVQEDIKNT